MRVALAAAALAAGAGGAGAATLNVGPGLDGLLRMSSGLEAGSLDLAAIGSVDAESTETSTTGGAAGPADAGDGSVWLAALEAGEAHAAAAAPDAPADAGPEAAGAENSAATSGGEELESPLRGARPVAGDILELFGIRPFGGPSPCHWNHPSFGSAEHRDRCGYPAVVFVASAPAPDVRFSGSIGGGSSGGPGPGTGAGPVVPPSPIPVPPAWILLATAAAPLLLRRRRT